MSVYINCKKSNKSVAVEVFQEKAPWVTFDRPQRAINGFGFHVNRVDYVVETDGEKGAWREGEDELRVEVKCLQSEFKRVSVGSSGIK